MRRKTIAAVTVVIVIVATSACRLTRTTPPTLPTAATPTSPQPAPTPLDRNKPSTTLATPPIPTTPATSRPMTTETPTHAALRFLDLDEELFPPVKPEKARALTESIAPQQHAPSSGSKPKSINVRRSPRATWPV